MSDQAEPAKTSATDSPWFWLSIFLSGALVALTLAGPKFSSRQRQLELQFEARQRAGQTVDTIDSPVTRTGETLITLVPLMQLFTGLLLLATIFFWWRRWRQ